MATLEILQIYWWIIISLLAGIFGFLMFIQGGQTLIDTLSTNEDEKTLLINSLGRKWELGFTTLVLFGGAMFAAFPKFYSTSFGGAYWVWLGILFSFILQAVSYEYRLKDDNFLGQKTYEFFLKFNGYVGVFLLSVAISTFYSGSEFELKSNFVIWKNSLRGLEALLNPFNYLLAFSLIPLTKLMAAMYFLNNINNKTIEHLAIKSISKNAIIFLTFFLSFLAWIFLKDGFRHDVKADLIVQEHYFNLINLLNLPIVLAILILGVILVLISLILAIVKKSKNSIFFIGFGVVFTIGALIASLGLGEGVFYPSIYDIRHSLTIQNSSSSFYTLKTMSYVSILVPFVLAYIIYAWYLMDRKKLDIQELNDEHYY